MHFYLHPALHVLHIIVASSYTAVVYAAHRTHAILRVLATDSADVFLLFILQFSDSVEEIALNAFFGMQLSAAPSLFVLASERCVIHTDTARIGVLFNYVALGTATGKMVYSFHSSGAECVLNHGATKLLIAPSDLPPSEVTTGGRFCKCIRQEQRFDDMYTWYDVCWGRGNNQ